jgi:glycopeptide antibiotics resistance protein
MKQRIISTFLLIAYSAVLIKVMVYKDVPMIRIGSLMIYFGGSQTGPANLVPFKTILVYLLGEKGLMIGGINLVGNIVLLMPVGFLVPLIFRNITWKKTLAVAVAFGFAIEGLQVVLRVGIFDIDDVILNGLGVMIGYWAFTILAKKLHSMKSENVRIAAVLAIVVVAAALFYGAAAYQKGRLPLSFEQGPGTDRSDHADKDKGGIPGTDDPCGGTDGVGQIVGTGSHAITIKARDGSEQLIKLTDRTKIRNSAGALLASNLKIGNRVTIVTFESDQDGNKIATVVLVCNTPDQEKQIGQ